MATLALSVAGAAAGSALLPAGISVLGATISGAVIGSQIGALAGAYVDQALFATSGQARTVSGPKLSDLKVTSSTEGAAVPRLFGRARIGGQVIWATPLEEEIVTTSTGNSGGGKGSSSGGSASQTTQISYLYYANFAVALSEGIITSLGRVWADGRELDLAQYTSRLHTGTETQTPDSLIAARQGADAAPAYRGIAYIVFERLPLAAFGHRLPQLSFEVHRAVDPFESEVKGTVLIPGSGEFVYAPEPVTRRVGLAQTEPENTHTRLGGTDWTVALDQLDQTLPNAKSTSLVVSWFGTDLRVANCQVRPAVDDTEKDTSPLIWSVAGLARENAALVSLDNGRAAYGGTPSDQTVIAAIRDLKARGHRVTLTPFILMDIPAANTLADPYSSGLQAPYPWRGRITVSPAPGRAGSPDKSPAAASQLAAFVGSATPGHFAVSGDSVLYAGPIEWSLRRMILHYATLAVAAGGVDAILIGSELRGLTQVRSGLGIYPFVPALQALAADVKSIVGPQTKVTYAADWSEYFGHQPSDESHDVYFHLDPLWASPAIDAIAIDCYWPLADWRDGDDHLDRLAGARSIYDLGYLKANLFAGEGYDWYYANTADRDAQRRTPIMDGSGKPWIFRFKDVRSWWQNQHFNRPGGVETSSPTAWLPQSKPLWLTEIGCPAVDRGANQPNVFVDPKSSESFLPFYSHGNRDDLMQRRYLQAIHEAFDPAHPGYITGANPVSSVYGGRMLDLAHVHVYAWDARPFPAFPLKSNVWGDGNNWRLGHWICGRFTGQPLAAVVKSVLDSYGFSAHDTSSLDGLVSGLVIDRIMPAREALSVLEQAHFFDAIESGDRIVFRHRGGALPAAILDTDTLVETRPGADLFTLTRAQETDLPGAARISYSAIENDYRQSVAASRRLVGASGRVAIAELGLVMTAEQASRIADAWLFEAWAARERAAFSLPPSRLALEPSDTLVLTHAGRSDLVRITGIGDSGERQIEAQSIDPVVYAGGSGALRPQDPGAGVAVGPALGFFLDLPLLTGNENPNAGYVAAARLPWPGGIAFYSSPESSSFTLAAVAPQPATTGITLDTCSPAPEGRIDHASRIRIRLDQGKLASITPAALLAGGNLAAIRNTAGDWEVLQFQVATLVAPATYELGNLLRGQGGSETAMTTLSPGARFILLDQAVTSVALSQNQLGLPLNWRFGPANRDLGDDDYRTETHAFSGRALRPLSPVHMRGRRTNGDLAVSWVRRTREGGDGWIAVDVPLAEESERYEVDVLSGSTVKRTIAATSPSIVYAAGDQTADFGAPQASITLRAYQISAFAGRGSGRTAVL